MLARCHRARPGRDRRRLSRTDRRQLVAAITEAKRPETRARRIEKAVAASS
ncbi:YdeI/OmpD-associated family protein [Nocardia sp. NPDC048505]|uniref:YdeI/OmpD-associated family protein n=1 Tax=unclassified Nocardia TaxID=2637762 RepID=UPI0033D61B1D